LDILFWLSQQYWSRSATGCDIQIRKPHEWVLFQVNKIHKMSCPSQKTNSKRKTLNGCCQMCIKTVKTSQKREKSQGAPPWKLVERKWRLERMGEKKMRLLAWKET